MERTEALQRLKFLYDQVHQTAERVEHLPAALPLDIHPESINYADDLRRIQEEYNHLADTGFARGFLSPADLAEAGLPVHWPRENGAEDRP
jgi:hypothetical protein